MHCRNKILILCLMFLHTALYAQNKDELKLQKEKLLDEINYTTNLLNNIKSSKVKSLNYLNVLAIQIKKREQFLSALNAEFTLLDRKIRTTELSLEETLNEIKEEEAFLTNLKQEYSKMIYAAFRQKDSRNDIVFIISASDFNQAYKRILYLKQYASFRKSQAEKITESKNRLKSKNIELSLQKDNYINESSSKKNLAKRKIKELESINLSKSEKQDLVKSLNKSEKVYKNKIKDKQKKTKKLDDQIRRIIEEEISKLNLDKSEKNIYSLTPEAIALSKEFSNNKGKLPWPLEKGVIIARYGKQKHSVFAGVETFNNGIDIATDPNSAVRAVFDGIVSRIFFIKGEGKAILINHGEFYSVYSGLADVSVKAAQKVASKEKIGVVSTNKDENKTQLHFEIWKGYEKADPSSWLYNGY